MSFTPTLIIGAGPAGLAMGARLTKRNLPFKIVERASRVVYRWHHHYDRLHLHTVKDRSFLPFVPFPDDFPQFVSREQIVEYCTSYADKFGLEPEFGRHVNRINRGPSGKWQAEINDSEPLTANNVVLATGINRIPVTPRWPGDDEFTGSLVHSQSYRNASPYAEQQVLVVGMGNTGAEIALDLAEHSVNVDISIRGPVNIVPLEAFGRPTQLTAIHLSRLPTWIQDPLAKITRRLTIGNLDRFGIASPSMSPTEQLRELGKTPVIDLGTVEKIRAGRITVRPAIRSFTSRGIIFANGESVDYDSIILATGYRSGIDQLIPEAAPILDHFGNPTEVVATRALDGLYFLGFDNYRPGGILGIINTDSKVIADHIEAKQFLT